MRDYTIKHIYIVICDKCNEDITRPLGGEDVETRAEAEQLVRDHQREWHADA
jgi:hypothetical protein